MVHFRMALTPGQQVRNDDAIFSEYVTISCAAVQHDEDDEAHSGMTKTARDFLKKKFGTISRFYSGISSADTANVNGFSRINTLRKALAALDRGGWERSYHQRIFHVSVAMPCVCVLLPACIVLTRAVSTGIVSQFRGSGPFQDRSTRIFRAILPAAARDEHLAEHQSGDPVGFVCHMSRVLLCRHVRGAWLTVSGLCAEFPPLGASAKPFRCAFSWQHWCLPVPWWKFQSTVHVSEMCTAAANTCTGAKRCVTVGCDR